MTEAKHFYIITMGCQMNVYDSEQMERLLAPIGYWPCSNPDDADLILVNTCSIREKPEHKVYSHLGRLARAKQKRPNLIIGVGGCVAQQEGERLIKRAPHVDIVFGPFAIVRLPDLVRQAVEDKRKIVDVKAAGAVEPLEIKPAGFQQGRATAFVTIMRGCDNFCTYCVVPYLRGREASRKPESIVEEIEHLIAAGVREVTLLGQNVNSYGMKNGHDCNFVQLLESVNDIEGLRRVRFTTSHPKDLSRELIGAFARLEKLAPHIHLPVQCGSNRILKRMNRGYTRDFYLAKIEGLRNGWPDIAITSDIIVGFPGESALDFKETLDLVKRVEFDNLYSFKYSDRPDVPASRFSKKVEEIEKSERLARLQEDQLAITLKKHQSLVGTSQEILVEGLSKKSNNQATGHTPCNKTVNFSDGTAEVGHVVPVKIIKAFAHSLLGESQRCYGSLMDKKGGMLHAA